MSGATVAGLSAAAALYYYTTKGCRTDAERDFPPTWETHRNVHSAPQTWRENLFFFAESMRYTYSETLGRWRTADLLIGLAYLSRRESEEHAAADIAQQGTLLGHGKSEEELNEAMAELVVVERMMRYCLVMREKKAQVQHQMFANLGIEGQDILLHERQAGLLKPSFVLVRDHALRSVVLLIRGTHSFKDMFTSLTAASKPHHLVDSNGVVLGYSHFGMLAAARWIKQLTVGPITKALEENPGFTLRLVGHSMGGGTAALLTMMLREKGGVFGSATCVALACPSCMTLELARSCAGYVTTVVNSADVVPTVSPGSFDQLREEVMRSSWGLEFRRDLRSSRVVRAMESGIRGVGSATLTATSWTTSKLSACYPRSLGSRRSLKRRNSDEWSHRSGDAQDQQQQEQSDGGAEVHASVRHRFGVASAADEAQALLHELQLQGEDGEGGGRGEDEWEDAGVASPTLLAMRSATNASVLSLLSSSAPESSGSSSGGGDGGRPGLRRGLASSFSAASPAGLAGSTRRQHAEHGDARQGPMWGMRLVGWGQQLGREAAQGSGVGSAPKAGAGRTGGLLARMWSQSCRPAAEPLRSEEGEAVGDGEQDGRGGAVQTSPPLGGSPMRMDHEGGGAGEEGSGDAGYGVERSDSHALMREVDLRVRALEEAVEDAEREEAQDGGGEDAVPSVIRPGSYGTSGVVSPSSRQLASPSSSSSLSSPAKQLDARWRRAMYPAGRILHLVPKYLCAPRHQAQRETQADGGQGEEPCRASSMATPSVAGSAGGGHSAPLDQHQRQSPFNQSHSPDSRSLLTSACPSSPPPGPVPSETPAPTVSDDVKVVSPRQFAASEEECGGVWVGSPGAEGDWEAEEEEKGIPRCGRQACEYVLLDRVPQQAYGRIKLCRRMLADHFIPCYLNALESAQRELADRRALLLEQRQQQEEVVELGSERGVQPGA